MESKSKRAKTGGIHFSCPYMAFTSCLPELETFSCHQQKKCAETKQISVQETVSEKRHVWLK